MAYVVTGRADTGKIAPRYEVRDLHENFPEQWSLFILGLTGVQYPTAPLPLMPSNFKPGSVLPPGADYFSIGGIHGMPYERWPGDPPTGRLNNAANDAEVAKVLGYSLKANKVKNPEDMQLERDGVGHSEDREGREVPLPGDEAGRYAGYCNHGSVLFPPWHRPYVMVLEQSIGLVATAIAKTFGGKTTADRAQKWLDAAKDLRFPFWDWTLEDHVDGGFPEVLKNMEIRIRGQDNATHLVPNPLACFRFADHLHTERRRDFVDFIEKIPYTGEPQAELKAFFRSWDRTVRWPKEEPETADRIERVDFQMSRLYADLRAKVAHIFTYPDDNQDNWPKYWDEFSNTTVQSRPHERPTEPGMNTTLSKSVEGSHNSIHLILGGAGHMAQNEFSGFDPAFYLHHSNVDRIYALWEYCYPNYTKLGYGFKDEAGKMTHFTQPQGTFTQLEKTRIDQWSDMLPWRKTANSYWTMNDATSLEDKPGDVWPKYYTYPPVAGVDVSKTPESYEERIKSRARLQNYFKLGVEENHDEVKHNPSPLFKNPAPASAIPAGRVQLHKYRHFVIACELKESAFNDSYWLELSFEGADENESFFGHVAVLTRPQTTRCAGCQGRRAVGNTVKGMINVPSKNVAYMLSARGHVGVDEAQEADFCKKRFKGFLVGRGGTIYAHTVSGAAPAGKRLEESIVPKVTFVSAYACTDGSDGAPVELFGFKNFAEVFNDASWVAGSP